MELSDDPRSGLKAALLPSGQAFTSLEEKLSAMASDCEMKNKDFDELQQLDGNQQCIDCGADHPDWGSPNLGILFCFNCSGQHRGLGTHISFVRSVTLDQWTEQQLDLMRAGGNRSCRAFLEQQGLEFETSSVRQRYESSAAALYKQVLIARVKGEPEPTELAAVPAENKRAPVALKDKIQGFGSSPIEPSLNVKWNKAATIAVGGSLLACGVAAAVYFLK